MAFEGTYRSSVWAGGPGQGEGTLTAGGVYRQILQLVRGLSPAQRQENEGEGWVW